MKGRLGPFTLCVVGLLLMGFVYGAVELLS